MAIPAIPWHCWHGLVRHWLFTPFIIGFSARSCNGSAMALAALLPHCCAIKAILYEHLEVCVIHDLLGSLRLILCDRTASTRLLWHRHHLWIIAIRGHCHDSSLLLAHTFVPYPCQCRQCQLMPPTSSIMTWHCSAGGPRQVVVYTRDNNPADCGNTTSYSGEITGCCVCGRPKFRGYYCRSVCNSPNNRSKRASTHVAHRSSIMICPLLTQARRVSRNNTPPGRIKRFPSTCCTDHTTTIQSGFDDGGGQNLIKCQKYY